MVTGIGNTNSNTNSFEIGIGIGKLVLQKSSKFDVAHLNKQFIQSWEVINDSFIKFDQSILDWTTNQPTDSWLADQITGRVLDNQPVSLIR